MRHLVDRRECMASICCTPRDLAVTTAPCPTSYSGAAVDDGEVDELSAFSWSTSLGDRLRGGGAAAADMAAVRRRGASGEVWWREGREGGREWWERRRGKGKARWAALVRYRGEVSEPAPSEL